MEFNLADLFELVADEVGDAEADAVVREIAQNAAAVRLVGTYPRWAAGRRGSIGWKTGDVPIVD